MPQLQEHEEKEIQTNRDWLWSTLKPLGCILVLIVAIGMLVVCFSAGRDPIKGYAAPQDTAYYAQHIEELRQELESNVLPQLDCDFRVEAGEGTATVYIPEAKFATLRAAVLRYFDQSIVKFEYLS